MILKNKYIVILGLILNALLLPGGCSNLQPEIVKVEQFKNTLGVTNNPLYPQLGDIYNFLNQQHQANPATTELYSIGKSQKNNLTIPMIRIGFLQEHPARKFLVVAGTHGDEAAPVAAVDNLIRQLLQQQNRTTLIKKKIVLDIIPVHNPEGYLENQRENDNGIDINRNFPFGKVEAKQEAETKALVSLINTRQYTASLFFHSANEKKYENLVRIPVEFNKSGTEAFRPEYEKEILKLSNIIIAGGNKTAPEIPWYSASDMVDVNGIASDWCVSGLLKKEYASLVKQTCNNPHPSVTIELCYPKQPVQKQRIESEQQELLNILLNVINKF
ncbi:MAG TPA: DUF2817 domain-containing protein [Bacteroidales bacterium]|nr:DUF2817 domain-containing protein [Bacteroidales bacterium]